MGSRPVVWLAVLLAACGWAQDGGVVVKPPEPAPADARPELVLQKGGAHSPIALSPDGRTIASATVGTAIQLWDVASRRPRGTELVGHTQPVVSLSFSPDGRWLVSCGWDGIRRWDAISGSPVGGPVRARVTNVLAARYSPDGRLLATGHGHGDHTVRLWDLATGQPLSAPMVGHTDLIKCLAFTPDGRLLASGSQDGTVRLWQTGTEQIRSISLTGHTKPVEDVAISNDAKLLASASQDGTVRLWHLSTGQLAAILVSARHDQVCSVSFAPDGRSLAAGCGDRSVRLWDTGTGQLCGAPWQGHTQAVRSVQFAPDGKAVAAATLKECILWDAITGRPLSPPLKGMEASANSVAFSPDGLRLAVGSNHNSVPVWDLTTGQPFCPALRGHQQMVVSVAYSPDGRRVASGSQDRTIRLWDLASNQSGPLVLVGHRAGVACVAFSPDGRRLASGSIDGTLRLWDVATGRPLGTPWAGHAAAVLAVSWSPDGGTVASGGTDRTVRLWDSVTGQPRGHPLEGHAAPVRAVGFSSVGQIVASCSDDTTVRLWHAVTGQPRLPPLEGHDNAVLDLAFSPDGETLATASADQTVRLWQIRTGQPHNLVLQGGRPVAFSPDGRRLVTGDRDGAIRIVELATGRRLVRLFSYDGGAAFLTVTPEGYYDCSPTADGMVQWRIGDHHYPFDQFAARYNRPDLVRRALAGEDISQAAPLDANMLPPNLAFVTPAYGAELAGGTVRVVLQAAGLHPIQRVDLTLNGAPLTADLVKQLVVDEPQETIRTFTIDVPLPAGEWQARLRAVAYDTALLRSAVQEVTVFAPGAKQQPGALHVLAVGLNHYAHLPERYHLRFAVPDAESMAKVLGNLGAGRPYTDVRTRLLIDQEATLSNLKFALRNLKDSATENDTAVVFISGHGVNHGETFYFPSYDVDLKDIPATALSWQDFAAAVRDVRAKRVLVLADTCHSGGIVGDATLNSELLAERLNKQAHQMVFTAAAGDEASLGNEKWGHGAFTKAFLEALLGLADVDPKDGAITLKEVRDYVVRRVETLTEGRQHPQLPLPEAFDPEAVFAQAYYAR